MTSISRIRSNNWLWTLRSILEDTAGGYNSNFENFVSVMLYRCGLWNTVFVVGPALQLSFIAIELHQSRHSHHILRVADFRVMLAKHEVWHLYVE